MDIEEKSLPLLGDDFPELNVQTTQGMMKLPDAFKGKWFILFSHPSDFTPVCTTEFVSFQKNYEKFKKLNCELIGLSVDQVFSHIKWIEWIKENLDVGIEFPIIADTGAVASSLGIIHPGKGTTTVRSVFIVDNNGKIRTILHYPQEMGRNIEEILRIVEGLQTGDKNKVAMPANWPENEIVSDEVIIPPIPTMDAIKERNKQRESGEISGYDWWFCHKKL
ncbi:MAG: peroxiredoxin [Methanobrevibacter arboriphilus]|uniref:Peroxiredoxin n=1 Tax=Methanobrevibacter arboriphilus TaxID=39441 RepID=A0A843AC86_METAZ|nr:peroxiredoxin [Methanobrevibacter arboriphilus]MBF4468572.1 peroxiredoxin [Methanobrevibacter arboriphilus]